MCLALAGCSKPAAPAGPSTAAKTPTAPPATPASSPPAVVIAPPVPDAALASAKDLKILVPAANGYSSDEETEALVQAIDKEVKSAARSKKPASRIVIYADTTLGYGCKCPPFVFAPLHGSGRPEAYVLPIFAKGVSEPFSSKLGYFRFAGHFDGRRITGFEWLKLRGEQLGQEERMGMGEYEHKAPVFIVEGWCFEPFDTSPEFFAEERYGDLVTSMAKEGRFCPASPESSSTKPDAKG
jgi:hypothetical protein